MVSYPDVQVILAVAPNVDVPGLSSVAVPLLIVGRLPQSENVILSMKT